MSTDEILSHSTRHLRAVNQVLKRVVAGGGNPDAAEQCREQISDRIFVGSPRSPVRVLERGTLGTFMPGSFEDPLGGLVSEILMGLSPEHKLVATERTAQQVAEIVEEKIQAGQGVRF